VALALIVFLMAIISEALAISTKTFRDLKATGDMAQRLRVTSSLLRRTLEADHFGTGQRLSIPTFWYPDGPFLPPRPPQAGFVRVYQQTPRNVAPNVDEGGDRLIAVPPPATTLAGPAPYASGRVVNCALHFTALLSGSNMSDTFFGYAPAGSPLLALGNPEARYQDPGGSNPPYSCQWAEFAFFLQPTPDTANGTPLYALYVRQRLLVPYNAADGVSPTTVAGVATPTDYAEVSATLSGTGPFTLTGNRPGDLTQPPRRFGMNADVSAAPSPNYAGLFANGSGYPTLASETDQDRKSGRPNGAANSQRLAGSDLLLTDVLSFEVRVLAKGWTDFADVFQLSAGYTLNNPAFNATTGPMAFDTWSARKDAAYDYSGWNGGTAANGKYDAIPMWDPAGNAGPVLKAVQITLRVWDFKTELTRQVTFVVAL
jgi:hypothetical protein